MNNTTQQAPASSPLATTTAADLMTANPVSIRDNASVEEAWAFLAASDYSAAPVIDEAGHPVGVLSRTDLLIHERERLARSSPTLASHQEAGPEAEDTAFVRDLMTPAVLAVAPDAPAADVLRQLVDQNVHRLFVVDGTGVLIGVISAADLLRHLRP